MKTKFILSIFFILAMASSADAYLIDNFSTDQSLLVPVNGSLFNSVNDGIDPFIIGSERDVYVTAIGGAADLQVTSDAGGSGRFAVEGTSMQNWSATIQWDGADGAASLNQTGLNHMDLTAGGHDRFKMLLWESDHPMNNSGITLEIFSDNGWSTYSTGPLNPVWQPGQEYSISFGSFQIGGGAGADFTNVGAIQLTMASSMGAHDIQLDYLKTGTVPLPGAVYLLGSGLIGLMAIRRKKRS